MMLCDCGKCTAVRNDMSIFLHNLLARIHRDGGHYTATHGLDKSVADADKIVADLYVTRDALTVELHEAYRRKDKSDTDCDALKAQLENSNIELLQADDELAAARIERDGRPSPSEAAKATCERCNPKGKRK